MRCLCILVSVEHKLRSTEIIFSVGLCRKGFYGKPCTFAYVQPRELSNGDINGDINDIKLKSLMCVFTYFCSWFWDFGCSSFFCLVFFLTCILVTYWLPVYLSILNSSGLFTPVLSLMDVTGILQEPVPARPIVTTGLWGNWKGGPVALMY